MFLSCFLNNVRLGVFYRDGTEAHGSPAQSLKLHSERQSPIFHRAMTDQVLHGRRRLQQQDEDNMRHEWTCDVAGAVAQERCFT